MDTSTAAQIVDEAFADSSQIVSVPGVAYGLVRDGTLVHCGGRGAAVHGGPVPGPDTVFRIASMTKSFTAMAVLMLRDEGRLRLDDPVAAHLPFATALSRVDGPPVTVRDLLSMGAGLPTDDPWGDRQESLTPAEFDALVEAGLSLCRAPRTGFEYSNTGYALLGRVVDEVAGMPYRQFVVERICRPMGMPATTFDSDLIARDRLATGYRIGPDATPIAQPTVGPGVYSAMGGLHSTVRDLAAWIGGFVASWTRAPAGHPVDRWSLREAQELARLASVDEFSGAGSGACATGYGYGLYVHEHRVLGRTVSHSGGYPGFGSHMRWHPGTGWGVVALGNATYAPMHLPARDALARIVEGTPQDFGGRDPVEVTPWAQTLAAMDLVEELLGGLRTEVLEHEWAPNMDLDVPPAERAADLAAARDALGAARDRIGVVHATPARAAWTLTGENGSVRLELLMTPEPAPRIQSLTVKPVSD
jgi:CubicO group peptidase (beta-lactamase class C family)